MALRIKKGAVIFAYGQQANSFTDQSELSQAILEHLKTRFPDEIEVGKPLKSITDEPIAEAEPAQEDAPVDPIEEAPVLEEAPVVIPKETTVVVKPEPKEGKGEQK